MRANNTNFPKIETHIRARIHIRVHKCTARKAPALINFSLFPLNFGLSVTRIRAIHAPPRVVIVVTIAKARGRVNRKASCVLMEIISRNEITFPYDRSDVLRTIYVNIR